MRELAITATTVMLLALVPPAYAETFSFHNESSFVDETKIMHVFGEIKNESGTVMKEIIITASFYDKDGQLLRTFQRAPELPVINPSESAPFEMLYIDSATVGNVADYTLAAAGRTADPKQKELAIMSSKSRLDVLGVYYINVVAKNEGTQTATNPIMVATLYDKDGQVVAIGKALAESGDKVADMEPGQEAGFGIVVVERLQTYKATKYLLVASSDQYTSEPVLLQSSGLGASSSTNLTNNTSGCLIATAAFRSELAPQVQELRTFRDGIALKTSAGSSFMHVFNAWYYSFSPTFADYERNSPWLQDAVRAGIYPLLGILEVGTLVHGLLAFNGEVAIVGAGLITSSLIGTLYFAPLSSALVLVKKKKHWKMKRAWYVLVLAWAIDIIALASGEATGNAGMLMFATTLLVLSAIGLVVLAIVRAVRW